MTPVTDSDRLHRPIAAIFIRLAAVAALGIMFALVKLGSERGVSLVESVFYRQLLSLPLILGWVALGPGFASLSTQRAGSHVIRMVMGLAAMSLNFLSMMLLPLAEATVIGFAVPLFATVLAALLLKEPTGRYRWGAVVLGLIGVILVVRPDGEALHSTGALVAVAAALATASVTIFIRQLGATEPAATTVVWFTASSLIPLGTAMLWFGQMHDPLTWALLLAMGTAGGTAQLLLTASLRMAPVSVVLPMDYTGLIWATLWGWLLFSTLPLPATWVGAPIIIASGLIILWREHQLGKAQRLGVSEAEAV